MNPIATYCADSAWPQDADVFYRQHHGWLFGWLRKKLGCGHNAADLAQDTFLRVLIAPRTEHGAAAPAHHGAVGQAPPPLHALREPRAYLTTVASRLLLNHYRRLSLERAYLDALALVPEAHSPSPEQRLLTLETLHEIDAMLDALPAKARTAFLLAQFEGLTYGDIADRLQVHVRTVKRYMAMAFEECILLAA